MGLTPFITLYNYESKLIRDIKGIKIIAKKARILV